MDKILGNKHRDRSRETEKYNEFIEISNLIEFMKNFSNNYFGDVSISRAKHRTCELGLIWHCFMLLSRSNQNDLASNSISGK